MKLQDNIIYQKVELAKQGEFLNWVEEHAAEIELADNAEANLHGTSAWFTVYNREDLQKLLTLAPLWKKSPSGKGIYYEAQPEGGFPLRIYAYDAALPPTCKVIRETVTIPARAEYTEIVEKLVCNVDQ